MSEGYPLITTKKMAFKTMVTELLWFLKGDTNIKYLVENGCHIWDGDAYKNYDANYSDLKDGFVGIDLADPRNNEIRKFTKEEFINKIKTNDEFAIKWGELGPIYGKQWRAFDEEEWGGIDQIQNLINDLKTNPDSRRLMVTAWNPSYQHQMVLPPCHYGFQVYT
jgi:thymidylate synthase